MPWLIGPRLAAFHKTVSLGSLGSTIWSQRELSGCSEEQRRKATAVIEAALQRGISYAFRFMPWIRTAGARQR